MRITSLFLLDKIVRDAGYSLENWPSMPQPLRNWATLTVNPLIAEQLNYDRDAERCECRGCSRFWETVESQAILQCREGD